MKVDGGKSIPRQIGLGNDLSMSAAAGILCHVLCDELLAAPGPR